MIWPLRLFFSVVLISMLWVTSWASLECTLWKTPHAVATHPWFIATLFDTYWGFLTFFCWVCYKQTTHLSRGFWLVAILLLGNIAMAIYMLVHLFRLPASASMRELLLNKADQR